MIIRLAQRLRSGEVLDFDQAVKEVERAVAVALDVIAKGGQGTNQDDFINAVLAQVAEKTRAGDFDGGASTIDQGLAELDRREAEQRNAVRRSRVALLQAGIGQDILRRDAVGVARRIETLVAIDHVIGQSTWLPAFQEQYDHFYKDGREKGGQLFLVRRHRTGSTDGGHGP